MVHLKVAIEGLQNGSGTMQSVLGAGIADSITVRVATANSPYTIVQSVKKVIDTNGNGDFMFSPDLYGNSYYLVVDHRNCLQTWSALPVSFTTPVVTYDFTTSASAAYGNNLVNVSGIYTLRSGDVNKDAIIDLNDISNITQSVESFSTGYIPEDLNGDSMVESADFSLVENNFLFSVSRP
jgi:hypothetical protein